MILTILGALAPFITWSIDAFIRNNETKRRMKESLEAFLNEAQKAGAASAESKISIDAQIEDLKRAGSHQSLRPPAQKMENQLNPDVSADDLNRQEANKHQ